MRTPFDLGPMFRHLQRAWRQIEDFSTLVVQYRFPAQTAPTALGTNCQLMNLSMIGLLDSLQGLT
jgi:hypothetical protein